jgi:peptide/nickel transport system substrate-binding protein
VGGQEEKEIRDLVARLEAGKVSRRQFMGRASALGLSLGAIGSVLAACGGDDDAAAPAEPAPAEPAPEPAPAEPAPEPAPAEPAPEPAPAEPAAAPSWDVLNLGSASHFQTLDPNKSIGTEEFPLFSMFEGLLVKSPTDLSIGPGVAEFPVERLDDFHWRATIREGATFTDGSPITAEDVKYSYDLILDPEYGSPYLDFAGSVIEGVTIVDPTTVDITAKHPVSFMPERLSMANIISKKHVEPIGAVEFGNNPQVCSGQMFNVEPFKNTEIVIERYDGYTGAWPVNAERVVHRVVPDHQARIAQCASGQLDIVNNLAPFLYEAVESQDSLELGVPDATGSTFGEVVCFNNAKKPWDDQRVRQAFIYSLNIDEIIALGNEGDAVPGHAALPDTHPFYTEPSIIYNHDPERAKSLLAEAGFPDGLDFELRITPWAYVEPQGPVIEANLKEGGFNPRLHFESIDAYFPQALEGKYEVYIFTLAFEKYSSDPDLLIRAWHVGFFPQSLYNWETPAAKRVEELLNEALDVQDESLQKEIYAEVLDILAVEAACPWIMYQPTDYYAWNTSRVGNVTVPRLHGLRPYGWSPA